MDNRVRSNGENVKGLPGYSAMRERFREMVEESAVTGGCSCGEFVFEGALRDERAAFRAHVELVHPERLEALDAKRRPQPMAAPGPGDPAFELLRRLDSLALLAAA